MKEVSSDDEADLRLLTLANHKGKFAIELGLSVSEQQQYAFERGIDNQWFTLVDVSPIVSAPYRLMRVFRLTEAGLTRRDELLSRKTLAS